MNDRSLGVRRSPLSQGRKDSPRFLASYSLLIASISRDSGPLAPLRELPSMRTTLNTRVSRGPDQPKPRSLQTMTESGKNTVQHCEASMKIGFVLLARFLTSLNASPCAKRDCILQKVASFFWRFDSEIQAKITSRHRCLLSECAFRLWSSISPPIPAQRAGLALAGGTCCGQAEPSAHSLPETAPSAGQEGRR